VEREDEDEEEEEEEGSTSGEDESSQDDSKVEVTWLAKDPWADPSDSLEEPDALQVVDRYNLSLGSYHAMPYISKESSLWSLVSGLSLPSQGIPSG